MGLKPILYVVLCKGKLKITIIHDIINHKYLLIGYLLTLMINIRRIICILEHSQCKFEFGFSITSKYQINQKSTLAN